MSQSYKMNNDITSEQRLRRVEILLETAAAKIHDTSIAIDRLTERTNSNAEAIDRLVEQDLNLTVKIAELTEVFAETLPIIRRQQVNIEEMQAEVRGLQVENRRILARVFGEEV